MNCRWCGWLEGSGDGEGHADGDGDEAAFVIGTPDAGAGNGVTLLPTTHVATLADLRPEAMADVLAGLSTLSTTIRRASGRDEIEIRAHPENGGAGHVHFEVVVPDGDRA